MAVYYNEIDPFAAQWLRNLIAAGHLPEGDVDERDIRDVVPADLRRYRQHHFFAGIGVWALALRRAGWPDDRPVWTGSCPCQPFSAAGKGAGFDDERHLWPAWHHLIRAFRPRTIFGEQVASKDGLAWVDLVQDDLEGTDYACWALDYCAAGCGAPHIRQRLWFVAEGLEHVASDGRLERRAEPGEWRSLARRRDGRLDDAASPRHIRTIKNTEGFTRDEARLRLLGKGRLDGGMADSRFSGLEVGSVSDDRRRTLWDEGSAAAPNIVSGGLAELDFQQQYRRGNTRPRRRAELANSGSVGGVADDRCSRNERLRRPQEASGSPRSIEREIPQQWSGAADRSGGASSRLADLYDGRGVGKTDSTAVADRDEPQQRLFERDDPSSRLAELYSTRRESRGARCETLGHWKAVEPDMLTSRLADCYRRLLSVPLGIEEEGDGNGSTGPHDDGGAGRPGPVNGFWRDADWLFCRDGKWRPARPGSFPLAHGSPARMGRLRAYGNAIVVQAATAFIEAYTAALDR